MHKNDTQRIDNELEQASLADRLTLINELCERPLFTTSLGLEDQVLTWAVFNQNLAIRIVTLQTGRLFPETLSLLTITKERYNLQIEELAPDLRNVEDYIRTYGMDGFYNSVKARKACCAVRKIEPLGKALDGIDGWVTGLRREQSPERGHVPFAVWDDERNLMKFNPLADWTIDQIKEAIVAHEIPVNPLHERSYPSIGCAPCTRAVKPGEPERAGRWWWEQHQASECGLHRVVNAHETTANQETAGREIDHAAA